MARAAVEGHPPEHDLHVAFGRMLYEAVFAGDVGELWQARLAELKPKRQPLCLVLRVDPASARPLLNLPWGLEAVSMEPLEEALRVLVLVAAPLGLAPNQVLNNRKEEDLILGATVEARRGGGASRKALGRAGECPVCPAVCR